MEFERARKQAFTPKQLEKPPGAGLDESLAYRWNHHRAGVDQQLCARHTGEDLLSVRVEAVAIGVGRDSEQAAFAVVALPRNQPRIFSQQLLQAFDVVVVNGACSLCCRALQTVTEAFAHLSGEVLPSGVAVLAREHELGIALG